MRNLLILALALMSPLLGAQQIRVAAAADLNPSGQEIAAAFQKKTGIAVQVSFGSSGNLYAQIKNGAPFDVFLSADSSYPQSLVDAGLASSMTEYARGTLVLWLSNLAGLDVSQGMDVLKNSRVSRIAIANPEHAPYGRAAVAALEHYGLKDLLKDKLVYGENVSQAAQFGESGNVQAALIALSSARRPAMQSAGKYIEVPRQSYPEMRQAGVVVNRSGSGDAARAFLQFLKSDEAKTILRKYGFRTE